MMLFNPKRSRETMKSHLTILRVLVLHLLLAHSCTGQSQLIGSSQPIVATLGNDIILPCHLEPAMDASELTVEWARPDLNPRFVHVWRSGKELVIKKHKHFEGRTSLFVDQLQFGNMSLKLSNVMLADQGTYKCFLPGMERQSLVELVVEDLFKHPDSSVSTIAGLAVSLTVCILLLLFFVWRWRQNITKNKTQHSAVTTEGGTDHPSNANRPEDQSVTEERETLMAGGTSQIQELKDNRQKKSKHNKKDQKKKNETELQNLKEEKKKNETELQNLKEEKKKNETELQNLKEEKKKNETELQNLKEEKKKNETELQNLKEELENKNKELDRRTNTREGKSWSFRGLSLQGQKTENLKENLKEAERQLEIKKTENSQLQRNWETKFNEETTKRKEAERQVDSLRKEAERQVDSLRKEAERQVDSLRKEPSTKACNIQDVPHQEASSSANQNSTPASGIVIEFNDQGQYIRLRNTSHQEQHLGGWMLEMKINRKNMLFMFEKSSKLKSGETVTMSGQGCRNRQLTPDLWWEDLKPFRPADKLKFTLINVHTDIRHELGSSVVEH